MRFNPKKAKDIGRLRSAMRSSRRKLNPFREVRFRAIEEYVGGNYSAISNSSGSPAGVHGKTPIPVNLMENAINIYGRQLIASNPRAMITTEKRELKPQAAALEIDINQLIESIKLERSLRLFVTDGLFGMGIMNVQEDEEGPFAEPIDLGDWVHDMTAKDFTRISFAGHRYRVPLWMAQENDQFVGKVRKELSATIRSVIDDEGEERTEAISQGLDSHEDEFVDHVELWDIWLPQERLVLTLSTDNGDVPLRIRDWDGPDDGPYHYLRFLDVPGQIMPLSIASIALDLHILANDLFVKLADQAKRQKTITVVQDSAFKDAESIRDAADGQFIRSTNPAATQEVKYGGIAQENLAFFLQTKDLFSYFLGNLDAIGGLSPQADTLGQEKMLGAAASKRVSDMQDASVRATKSIVTALARYEWNNPLLDRPIKRPIPDLPGFYVDADMTAENLMGEFPDYDIDIDPYSMRDQSPGERLQALQMVFQNYIVPFLPMLEQQGMIVDFDGLLKIVAKLSGMKELEEILIYVDRPEEIGEEQGRSRDTTATRPAVTHRINERINRPGATQQGKDAVLSQLLFGGNPQRDETAQLARSVS